MTINILSDKAVLAKVKIRHWIPRKLDRKVTDEVNQRHNAGPDAGRYNKVLIARKAFRPIYKICNKARTLHHVMTMPWSDEGSRILPNVKIDEFNARFRDFRTEFNEAADEFEKNYQDYIKAAKKTLNGMFDRNDYPPQSEIRKEFDFYARISPCPDDFRGSLSPEQAKDLKKNLDVEMKEILEQAMRDPIERVILVAERMSTKLKEYKPATEEDRAENTFRDSLVENIRELVPLLEAFNLTGDKKLTALTARIRKELCANDAYVLREDEDVRSKVCASADAILKQAQSLLA